MKASIDNAYARVRRAKQHLARLKRERTIFRRTFHPPQGYINPKLGGTITLEYSRNIIPKKFGILIGETIYNLRAALDYLVYELAILDSGQTQKETQFPIEDTPEGWQRKMNGTKRKVKGIVVPDWGCSLRGLSNAHKEDIKLFQPCFGFNLTGTLQSISNPDKHRTLTIIRPMSTLSVKTTSKGFTVINPAEEGKTILFEVRSHPKDDSMDVNADVAFDIAFDDRTLVIETLQILHSQVTKILDQFKPEFK
jgi:hypothetical protein